MPNADLSVVSETVYLLPVGQLHKSPSQPRRRGETEPDEDFIASIRSKGVVQPIIVRVRKAGGWEIVFGHRRWEGSKLAKYETVPAIVRELTDDAIFELQLIENVQRQDMHPLDEADGFKRMMQKNGRSAAYIAEHIGRPVSYVVQRLKLIDLAPAVREKLDKDKISLGIAMLLARVPAALQAEAAKSLWGGIDYEGAKHQLEERFLLRLSQAPFGLDDANLVPKAGACADCPKRTGQQRELFPDAGKVDMCIDPACYRSKLDAVWQIRKREAAEGGDAILEGAAAKKAMEYNGGYKKLDDHDYRDPQHRTVRAILGKDLPPITLARDEKSGVIYELAKESDVKKKLPKERSYGASDNSWQKRKEQDQRVAAAVEIAVAQAVGNAKRVPLLDLLRLMTASLVPSAWDKASKILERRGFAQKKTSARLRPGTNDLEAYLASLKKQADVASLGFELALREFAPTGYGGADAEWAAMMKRTGVNFAAIQKKIAADAAAKKKAKGKKPAKKAA